VFGSKSIVRGEGCQTLALHVGNHVITAGRLTHNGTAVEGVCVTGEAIRQLVPVASRYGAIFAITVRKGFITIALQVVC